MCTEMHASLNVNWSSHCSFLIQNGEWSRHCSNIMKVWSVVCSCYMSNKNMLKLILTYLLTPWSRSLLEKLTGFQLVKKFPAFYATQRFITTFTSAHHLSLSWASFIQSIPPHPTTWRSILILSSHLCLGIPSGLFPSGFPGKANRCILATLHFNIPKIGRVYEVQKTLFTEWHYTVDLPFGVKFEGSYLLLTILDRILFCWGSSKFIALHRIVTSNVSKLIIIINIIV